MEVFEVFDAFQDFYGVTPTALAETSAPKGTNTEWNSEPKKIKSIVQK